MSSCSSAVERFWLWATRCIPGLLTFILASLVYLSLIDGRNLALQQYHHYPSTWPSPAQLFFIAYGIILHISALNFPIRLCRAARSITHEIMVDQAECAARAAAEDALPAEEKETKETQVSFDMMKTEDATPDIIHAIMVPSYKEDVSTLEDTLKVLASHTNASKQYHVGV